MPVRKQNRDTSRSLATFLETAVRQDTGDESFIPVERLYEQFIASGMDYAGALSSGYSEGGLSLTVTAGIDWGKLIAPFGPFTLESTASGAGQRARRTLLVIQRQPQSPSPSDSFWCGQPICVMNLAGVHWQFKTKLNLTAEVGLPDNIKKCPVHGRRDWPRRGRLKPGCQCERGSGGVLRRKSSLLSGYSAQIIHQRPRRWPYHLF